MTSTRRNAKPKAGRVPAQVDPVARLMVDVPLPHLDRPFDYAVPAELSELVVPGARVRVRFAGRLVDAYVLDRTAKTDHVGTLAMIERAVGGEPVLTAQTAALFRAVADRWAGNFVDVVRLGVPPRHAAAESGPLPAAQAAVSAPSNAGLQRYRAGSAFLAAIGDGRAARAAFSALPGERWPARYAECVAVALAAGRGAIAVVPDARDLARLDDALTSLLGEGHHVALSAELGPAERYRRWLAAKRGTVRAVIGTRAAAYAPVHDLGLVMIWDDGDDLYDEPRAPYAHTRDVLVLRSAQTGAALLAGGYARTAEVQQLVESGWAHEIAADRATLRTVAPRVVATGEDAELERDPAAAAARLPSLAWRTTREALATGHPVLIQVPRRGYVPSLACARDRTPARCSTCCGPIASTSSNAVPSCRWCGRPAAQWQCPACGGRTMRAVVVGARRTAEELGRAFPGATVRTSGGDRVLASVPGSPDLVICTPGAEPIPPDGYGAALLLDGWALLSRADLRAGEETLRRWMAAASLVRPGGVVVVGADASVPAVQALVRWDPGGSAARELAERGELSFPPAVRMASLTGPAHAIRELLAGAQLPDAAETIGPVPIGPVPIRSAPAGSAQPDQRTERVLIRVPRQQGAELATALKSSAAGRSARKAVDPVKVVLDAMDLI